MFFTQAARQLTLRIALLVMLLVALAPTLSHAMRAAGGDVLVDVCSAVGAKLVTGSQAGPQDTAPATTPVLDDCPYCILQGHAAALPSAPGAGLATKALRFSVPLLFLHAPHTLHAWVTAQPRAPPLAT